VTNISLTFTGLDVNNLNSMAIVLVPPSGSGLTPLDLLSGLCGTGTQQIAISTFTLADTASGGAGNTDGMLPGLGISTCPGSLSGTYYPTDWYPGLDTFTAPGPGTDYNSAGLGQTTCSGIGSNVECGSYNFSSFGETGSLFNGSWNLYMACQGTPCGSGSLTSWSLAFTGSTSISTTTSISANPNGLTSTVYTNSDVHGDATAGTPVTLAATVSPNPGGGSVTFYDSTSTGIPGTGTAIASNVALSSGTATTPFTFPGTEEGPRTISAVYNPTTGYLGSTSTTQASVLTVNHPYNPSGATYCNGPVTVETNSAGAGGTGGFPYPSQLILSGVTGTIEDVTVTLNGLQVESPNFMGFGLQAPNGNAFEFLSWADGDGPGSNNLTPSNYSLTLADDTSTTLQTSSSNTCTGSTCSPADDYSELLSTDTFPAPPSPFSAPATFGRAYPAGSSTFTSEFGGAGANGTWLLYLNNWLSEDPSTNPSLPYGQLNSWCVNLTMQPNAHATTTTVSGSPNPAAITAGSTATVNLTANVTVTDGTPLSDDSNPGTVTFVDGSTNLGTANVSSGGVATQTASLGQGTHQIVATYSGTSSGTEFGVSSASADVRVDYATTIPASGSGAGPYTYCDTGSISAGNASSGYDYGPATPYPSNIYVTGLPGTVSATTVTLKNFNSADQEDLMSLLVGPGSKNLEFFSLTGVRQPGATVSPTFADGGSSITANLTGAGPYEPTSNNGSPYNTAVPYPQCSQNAPLCGTESVGPPLPSNPFTPTKAAPVGSSILGNASEAGVFGGTTSSTYNGNGTWSLYIDDGGLLGPGSATTIGGWCVNLTVNLPSISFSGPTAGSTFKQGDSSDSLPEVIVTNNGIGGSGVAGSIGDPTQTIANAMTVVDTLPTGLTYSGVSGTDWACSAPGGGPTVTCTNQDTVAVGTNYNPLTIEVSVSPTLFGLIGSNKVSVSDAEASNTPASQSGSVTIDEPPAITSANAAAFTAGVAGTFTVTTTGYPTPALSETGTALPAGVTFTDNGNGTATLAGTTTAAGIYSIVITASNGTSPNATQSFTLTVSPAAPSSMTANSGTTPQMTTANTAFPNPLAVTVTDSFGNPVSGVSVTFTAPSSGASGTFSNSTGTITVTTNGSGVASAGTFTANSMYSDTPYTVSATGSSLSASFTLTNVIANILWIGNPASDGTTSAIRATGVPVGSSAPGHGGTGVAVDSAADVWSLDGTGNTMTEFTVGGTKLGISGGGLSAATSLAIDGSNQVWVTNTGGTLSVFNSSGAVTPTTGYTVGTTSPTSIAIDISGNVWIANSGNGSVTKVLGAATPTVPLVTGVAGGTPAAKP
jgi:hypothetical protein